jgi:lipopolysaccharide/colanic/teichoic acid biosynthesis glycosyltransferase
MELLQTIALLCQINGWDASAAIREQLQCQQYYVKCLSVDINITYKTLSKCVLERK